MKDRQHKARRFPHSCNRNAGISSRKAQRARTRIAAADQHQLIELIRRMRDPDQPPDSFAQVKAGMVRLVQRGKRVAEIRELVAEHYAITAEIDGPPDGGEPLLNLFAASLDQRAQIRRDRGYVGQAGPPPDLKCTNARVTSAGARKLSGYAPKPSGLPVHSRSSGDFPAQFRAPAFSRPRGRR